MCQRARRFPPTWSRPRLRASTPISRSRRRITEIPRIAKARSMSQAALEQMVNQHIQGRFLGLFGEPVVNVLELNLALDNVTPSSCN